MESQMVPIDGADLHVRSHGTGPDVVFLSGGPGCVHYLAEPAITPTGFRCWFPEPRGVGNSTGGAHTMAEGIADLETLRSHLGIDRWIVVGHSWGCEMGVRYALERPGSVTAVIGIAGTGPQRDRSWSAEYQAGKHLEPQIPIDYSVEVWEGLRESFQDWIHTPQLWRSLADCSVPMQFIAAGADCRPSWPLAQLAALVPHGSFATVPDVPHDFWHTNPDMWLRTVAAALTRATDGRSSGD